MCMNLKCHESVNILSFKHTYQPMRARVVAQLFYTKHRGTIFYLKITSGFSAVSRSSLLRCTVISALSFLLNLSC